jgi:hypothetical protein
VGGGLSSGDQLRYPMINKKMISKVTFRYFSPFLGGSSIE